MTKDMRLGIQEKEWRYTFAGNSGKIFILFNLFNLSLRDQLGGPHLVIHVELN